MLQLSFIVTIFVEIITLIELARGACIVGSCTCLSSSSYPGTGGYSANYAVDNLVSNGRRSYGFFHSNYEAYPWLAVCAGSTTSTITKLNGIQWYSRSDAAQVGQKGLQIEVRYEVPRTSLRSRQRITSGKLCGTITINGDFAGESEIVTCPGAPITLASTDGSDLITLQLINSQMNFLMVGEVIIF